MEGIGPQMSVRQLKEAHELYTVLFGGALDDEERQEYAGQLKRIDQLLLDKRNDSLAASSGFAGSDLRGSVSSASSSRKRAHDDPTRSPNAEQHSRRKQRTSPSPSSSRSATGSLSEFLGGLNSEEAQRQQQEILDQIMGERDARDRSEALVERLQEEGVSTNNDFSNWATAPSYHGSASGPAERSFQSFGVQNRSRSSSQPAEQPYQQLGTQSLGGSTSRLPGRFPPSRLGELDGFSSQPAQQSFEPFGSQNHSHSTSRPAEQSYQPFGGPSFGPPSIGVQGGSSRSVRQSESLSSSSVPQFVPASSLPAHYMSQPLPLRTSHAQNLPWMPQNVADHVSRTYQQFTQNNLPSWSGMFTGARQHHQFGTASQPLQLSSDDDTGDSDGNNFVGRHSFNPGLYPTHPDSFENAMRERGLDGLLADPTRSREDLQKLLENLNDMEDIPEELRMDTPAGMTCPLMPHQRVGLSWLKKQEESSHKGGILADAMGLGKTVQAIALMLARPSEERGRKTTLIVVPLSLLNQWPREIHNKVKPSHRLSVYVYHGQTNKKNMTVNRLMTYDVVVTNYDTLASEFKRREAWDQEKKRNPRAIAGPKYHHVLLHENAKFHRIILDEAHLIKNRTTQNARSATLVNSTYRLCMTGTPLQNNVEELYSLIRFLRIGPYNVWDTFNRELNRPLKQRGSEVRSRAMQKLHALLKSTLLKRDKDSKIDGKPIIQLPERTTHVAAAEFDEDQMAFYTHLEQKTQLRVNRYLKAGTIGKNYSNILALLLRLRQACCHPALIRDHGIPAGTDATTDEMVDLAKKLAPQVVTRLTEREGFECPICFDAVLNPTIVFPCGHNMCGECFSGLIDNASRNANEAKCPECRAKIDPKLVISYSFFMKAHMPQKYREEYPDDADMPEDSDDSDSDSSEDDDDVDGQGNLLGFVVVDDADETDSEDVKKQDALGDVNGVASSSKDADDDSDYKESKDSDEDSDLLVRERASKGKEKESSSKPAGKKPSVKAKGTGKAVPNQKKKKVKAKKRPKVFTSMADLKRQSMRNAKAKRRYLKRLERDYTTSAKIEKTMELLESIEQKDPEEKTIIFSQFTSFLDLLEIPMGRKGYNYRRYDGSMSSAMRDMAVTDFTDKAEVKVMLISLKAGNAGLNLNVASQVIILDPFWNPFIEEQAIDRAHRIGQQRPVHVHRVLVANTVEDRILALQEKKRDLVNEALSEEGARNVSRLGQRELAYLFGIAPSV